MEGDFPLSFFFPHKKAGISPVESQFHMSNVKAVWFLLKIPCQDLPHSLSGLWHDNMNYASGIFEFLCSAPDDAR